MLYAASLRADRKVMCDVSVKFLLSFHTVYSAVTQTMGQNTTKYWQNILFLPYQGVTTYFVYLVSTSGDIGKRSMHKVFI